MLGEGSGPCAQAHGAGPTAVAADAGPRIVIFDCETTGTIPGVDEIVSLAVVRLDAAALETGRYVRLVRPSRPIPVDATAVHGITDNDVRRTWIFFGDPAMLLGSATAPAAKSRESPGRNGVTTNPVSANTMPNSSA